MVQLPRFLPHSRCTRRTDDCGSSVCEKPSDQRSPGTADRRRQASPRAPGSASVRWRGSLRKTWSSEPNGISTPARPPQLASHRRRALAPSRWSASCSLWPWSPPLSPAYIAHSQRLYAQRLSAGSRKPHVQRLNKIGRLCRLVPLVRPSQNVDLTKTPKFTERVGAHGLGAKQSTISI